LFIEKLKERWKVKSVMDVVIILVVFALTGSTVMLLRKWMVAQFDWAKNDWFTYSYYWLVIPIYNMILLGYGYIFGKFNFFWEFEKRTFNRIKGIFVKRKGAKQIA